MKRTLLGFFILLFTVSIGFSQTFVEEDFESGSIPGDWGNITNASDGGWLAGNAATLGSAYWGIPENGTTFVATNDDGCNCDKSNDILALPAADLSSASKVFIGFDMIFAGGTYGGATEVADIVVSYDGGTTWDLVQNIAGTGTLAWTSNLLDVSSIAGNASAMLGFRYNDNGGWLFGFALDNIKLSVPPANDIRLSVASPYKFLNVGEEVTISGIVQNLGGEELTGFEFSWTDGTNVNTDMVTGLSIASLAQDTFEHTIAFTAATPDEFVIGITALNPNGNADADEVNNAGSFDLAGVMDPPFKQMFLEESTGTWCPWCPRGAVFMDKIEATYPDKIASVAVHVGQQTWPDPMQYNENDYAISYAGLLGGLAFPTLVVDRVANPGIPALGDGDMSGIGDMDEFMEILVEFTDSRPSPLGVTIEASIDGPSRMLTADLTISTHSRLAGTSFAVNVLVTEDHVTGDANAYRQANNYAGGAVEPMAGYEALPNPVSGNDMEYNHTLRKALNGGISGMTGLIPADIEPGQTFSQTFTWEVPAEYDINELNVLATVFDMNNNGAAYNADIARGLNVTTSLKDQLLADNVVKVFPNPFSDQTNIEVNLTESSNVSIEVIDAMGKSIAVKNYGSLNGQVVLPFMAHNLQNGVYFIQVRVNDKISTEKVTIAR